MRPPNTQNLSLEILVRGAPRSPHPPVVLVHGAWHGAWCWDMGFLDRLASRGLRCHAVSLRGHGNSPGDPRHARIRDYVEDVERLLDSIGVEPVLVGHSMGGHVVRKVLERRGAAGAVLMSCVPPRGVAGLLARMSIASPLTVLRANAALSLAPVVSSERRVRDLLFTTDTPEATVAAIARRLGWESYFAFLDMLLLDLCPAATSNVPALVLAGTRDGMFTASEANAVARAHDTTVSFVNGAGHDLMVESGWETTADRVAEWCLSLGENFAAKAA